MYTADRDVGWGRLGRTTVYTGDKEIENTPRHGIHGHVVNHLDIAISFPALEPKNLRIDLPHPDVRINHLVRLVSELLPRRSRFAI